MTRSKRRANRIRLVILVAGVVYTLAAVAWMILPEFYRGGEFTPAGLVGTPFLFGNPDTSLLTTPLSTYAANVLLVLGLLLLAQWAILRPGRGLARRLAARGRPLRSSVIAAAAMAMLLTVGFATLVLEMTGAWGEPAPKPSATHSFWWEMFFSLLLGGGGGQPSKPDYTLVYWWGVMLVLWAVWTWVFWIYWRQGDRYTQTGKMIRALVAGSLLEALVAVPVHIMVTRQDDCYCARGTYVTLVFSGTVLLWAFGPGIILLYMRERYRQASLLKPCPSCGYSLRGNESGKCPECGTEIDRP